MIAAWSGASSTWDGAWKGHPDHHLSRPVLIEQLEESDEAVVSNRCC